MGPNVAYNRLGTATAGLSGVDASDDLLISGSLEVGGTSQFDNGLTLSAGNLVVTEGSFTVGTGTFGSGVNVNSVLNLGNNPTAPILAGVVSAFRSYHAIAAEGGPGADTLDTINGGVVGDLLIIKANTGDTITIPSATGNIITDGSVTIILSGFDLAVFIFDGTNWLELSRSSPAP